MATIPNQTQNQSQTTTGAAHQTTSRAPGLTFDRHFTKPGVRRTSRFLPTGP